MVTSEAGVGLGMGERSEGERLSNFIICQKISMFCLYKLNIFIIKVIQDYFRKVLVQDDMKQPQNSPTIL